LPGDTLTRLEQWSSQDSSSWTTADWDTGVYTEQFGLGAVTFINAPSIINFVNSLNGVGQIYFSVNGGPQLAWDGTGSGGTDITFYTPTLPATDPTTVTSFEYFYSYKSGFEIDYDSNEVNIYANDADINLQTNQGDIELISSGDMSISGNGTVGLTNYSDASFVAITTDASGGSPKQWQFGVDGNLTLPGNTFAVNYANGDQVSLSGTYGDSNVSTYLASGTNTDGFSSAGNITLGGTGSPISLQEFSSTPTEVTLGWSPSISPAPFDTGDTVLVEGGSGVDGSWTVVSCDTNGVTIDCDLNPGSGFYTDLPGPTVSLVYISTVTASGSITGVNLIATGGIFAGGTIVSNGDITAVSGNVIAGEVQTPSLVVNGTTDLGSVANVTITGGTAGQILSTDGSGTLSWTSQSIVIGTETSGATITPTGSSTQFNVTALAESATFAAPSGTPTDGQKLTIRILDNGTPQTLAWNAVYQVIGTTLPTTTVANKYTYVGCIYNAQSSKWDVVSVAQEA
jgi:hypothetical protein